MKSVLNITAPNNQCVIYCLLGKLHPVDNNAERHTKYLQHTDSINLGDVTFPVKISNIGKVEALNNLSVSVFEWSKEDDCVIPIRHGSGIGMQIDLLYLRDEYTGHFLLIKNFNGFMRHRSKQHNSMYFCRRCLHGCTKKS